jgi:hypothetical protein
MKTSKNITIPLTVVTSIALGCLFFGRVKSEAEPRTTTAISSAASDVLQRQIFNHAFADVAFTEAVIELLDSSRIEDAKSLLRTHQNSSIFSLDQIVDAPAVSEKEIAELRELNESITPKAKQREGANRALARVAHHRAEHPWTYKGSLSQTNDPEVEAHLAAILSRAAASQK